MALDVKSRGFELTSWADGFGRWHCRADFDFPGVGNTPEAEALKYRALDACKRKIRKELQEREASKLGRVRYEVSSSKLDPLNRMHSITVSERWPNEC